MSPAPKNNNVFITENMRALRTAFTNLNEYMEERGLADLGADIPTHPKQAQCPRFPSTVNEWALQTAIDIDALHLRLALTQDKAKKARRANAAVN